MLSAKFDWSWPRGSAEEFLKICHFFCNYPPLEKGGALHLNKLESLSPKDAGEIGPIILENENFQIRQCIFAIINYLPWKRSKLSCEQTWILLTQGWFVPSLVEMAMFWRKRFFKIINVILKICNFVSSPLGKGQALCLNKHEFPLTKDSLCLVWLKLAKWILRRR